MGKRVFAIGALVALLATGVLAAPPGAGAATEAAPRAATEVLAVDAGETSSCGLDAAGAAFCWGSNHRGELGDGTTTNSLLPVAVARGELPSDAAFTTVTVAGEHACALTQAGRPYCWGSGHVREDGGSVPVAVGDRAFTMVTAGGSHTCGLTAGGAAYCWGSNWTGQLGDGTTTLRTEPVAVSTAGLPAGTAFTALSAGDQHTCGVARSGVVYCWGDNEEGELGDSTHTFRLTPVAVAIEGKTFSAVAAGEQFTCAVTVSGTPYCWGYSISGRTGPNDWAPANDFARFWPAAPAFTSVTAGRAHACGLTRAGAAYCWGWNGEGQLGDSTIEQRLASAVQVGAGGVTFASLSAGLEFTCGLTTTRTAYCWGANRWGQLGNGTTTNPAVPTPVTRELGFAALATGNNHTCGLTTAGAAYCWGRNVRGQVGDGTWVARSTPVAVAPGTTFTKIIAGDDHSCGLAATGAVHCWGWNFRGQLGNLSGENEPAPVAVVRGDLPAGTVFTALTAGDTHTCGLAGTGVVYCWGGNRSGQLGDDTTTDRPTPAAVSDTGLPGGTRFTAVAAAGLHTCALATTGVAYCWGLNDSGQLGDGTTSSRLTPVAVAGPRFATIAAGHWDTCGLTAAGAAYCWGGNRAGQLGDGTMTDRTSPTVVSMSNVPAGKFVSIQPTWTHTCALTADGKAYCWAADSAGELGGAENYPGLGPAPVTMPAGVAFADLALGYEHSCARSTANVAYCWGQNEDAQLGMGLPWKPGKVSGFPDAAVPEPPDTTAPSGSFTVSRPAFWIGQRTTLILSGVSDDVSGGAAIRRVVTWGDGTTSTLDPAQATIGKQYPRAGRFTITLTLSDAAGNKRTQSSAVTVTAPGAFRLDRAAVLHHQPVKVTISAVPAGTTKIALNWGDGYVSNLSGRNQTVSHSYYHKNRGGLVPVGAVKPTAVFTNPDGSTLPMAVGTVAVKKDSWSPKTAVTKPRHAKRVSSWKTLRGRATDQGSGIRQVSVVALRASAGKTYCYTAGKTWITYRGSDAAKCRVEVKAPGGKWSLPLKGLAKGKLTVTVVASDWSDRSGKASVSQQIS
jgi:alpha-tubulin suppressor-like RCC1 family protein